VIIRVPRRGVLDALLRAESNKRFQRLEVFHRWTSATACLLGRPRMRRHASLCKALTTHLADEDWGGMHMTDGDACGVLQPSGGIWDPFTTSTLNTWLHCRICTGPGAVRIAQRFMKESTFDI
jgi:hypothetical protein